MADQHHPTPSAPDEFHPGDRKRRRKALSCFDCRRRKLRCDREFPSCRRCIAQAQPCTYETGSLETASPALQDYAQRSKTPEDALDPKCFVPPVTIPRAGETATEKTHSIPEGALSSGTWQGFGEVASIVTTNGTRTAAKQDTIDSSVRSLIQAETIYFKGLSYATQYYGGTNPTSQLSHFPELRSFMKEAIMQHSSLPRVQRDVKGLQFRWKSEKANALPFSDSNLIELLPEREKVDRLCRLYFDTFESLYRILHGPAFWKEYHIFWEDTKSARSSFVVTILLMMAAVNCISTSERPTYIGDSSKARQSAVLWIEAAESWLQRQPQKHAYLTMWQIRCLLVLGTLTNTVKKKRAWTSAGHLIRHAMSAGFHRDPSLLGSNISVFDQEMRRRLWATMVELELQASIDRGMPSASAGIPCDTAPPINVDDEELGEELQQPPTPKSKGKYTCTSFLRLCRSSLELRVSLNTALNGLAAQVSYEEATLYEGKIMEKLRELPAWASADSSKASRASEMPRMLLDIQLRQFLLMLHGPYARRAESNSRYSLSKMVCFNAASSILDQHTKLVASENYTLILLRSDVFRCALLTCHYAYVASTIHNDVCLSKLSNGFFRDIENALNILGERITRLGTGYTNFWYLSAANSLIHSKTSLANSTSQKQEAVDRVLRQYYKVLASQEDMTRVKEEAPFSAVLKPMDFNIVMPTFDELLASNLPQTGIDGTDPAYTEYYYGDPAAWVFDNLPTFDQLEILPGL